MKMTSKRRRGKQEIIDQKEAEEREKAETKRKLEQFEDMQKQILEL
jgi:hypothetical protein